MREDFKGSLLISQLSSERVSSLGYWKEHALGTRWVLSALFSFTKKKTCHPRTYIRVLYVDLHCMMGICDYHKGDRYKTSVSLNTSYCEKKLFPMWHRNNYIFSQIMVLISYREWITSAKWFNHFWGR